MTCWRNGMSVGYSMVETELFQSLRHCVVAYSGGVDSHVLLHLMAGLQTTLDLRVTAVHVNHGLSDQAARWATHCQEVCQDLSVPFSCVAVTATPKPGDSPEAAARLARYAALSAFIDSPDTALLTAHHQDDQAETVLLQLMRGCGVKGLSGMPRIKPFGKGSLLRPLLNHSQEAITAYANAQSLRWVEDDSNKDVTFDRNFIRHQVMPLLQSRRAGVNAALQRSAIHAAEASELLDALAATDLEAVVLANPAQLDIQALRALSAARQRNVLRYWLQQLGLPLPSTKILSEIQSSVLHAKPSAKPRLQWAGVTCWREGLVMEASSTAVMKSF